MKRTLSFILAIMMVISLGTCFSVNATAEEIYVPEDGTMQNIEIAKVTAAPTMDGKVDSSYSKIFDISGADTWYLKPDDSGALVWGRDNHSAVDYNSESRRYDAAINPERTSSEWYNSRIEGYASWDATNLYLCIVITTPHEINDNPGGRDSWMGDDLEIAVQNVSKNAATKFVMSQVAGALQVYPADVAGLGISKSKTYDTTGLVNKTKTLPGGGFYKTETGYVYELTLAWKTGFGITAKSGDSIPFNAAVNFNNAAADAATSCGIQAGAGIYNEGGKVNLLTKDSDNKSLGFAIKLVDSISCAHTNTEWVAGKAFSATEGSGTEHKVCKDCGKKLTTRYVNEAAEAAILVSSASAKVGEEVEITVGLKNNPGIVSMALAVEFPSALTLVEVKDAGKLGATVHSPSLSNPYYLNWVNDTATINFTVNGTIATLKFKVNENAADNAEYDIKVSYTPDNYEIYDKDGNEVDFAIENGKITVTPCNHTGGEATCISPAICEICGKPYGDVNPDNHKNTEYRNAQEPTCNEKGKEADLFCLDCQKVVKEGAEIPATGNHVCASGEWKYDENGHFHVCDNCQTEFGRENHKGGEATCKAAAVCEVCGTSYGTVDANNHKNVVLKNNVAPTCKDPGYSGDKVCEDCGTTVEAGHVIAATGNHIDADGKWEFDGTNHFHTCGCGTKFDFAPHEGGEATCVAAKVCEVCGASYGDVDPDNHKNTEYRNAQAPTCSEKGKEADLFCLDCQKVVKEGAEIPATGNHVCVSGEWKHDENGHFHICDNCQTEFGRENHKGGEATCKDAAVCEVCGTNYGDIDANNHKNIVLKNNVAPTCKDPGYSGDKVCEDCGTVVETGHEIAATGNHIDADGKWEFDGTNHFHTCGCGTKFDFAPHEGGEATCVAAKVCEVCGASYGDIDPDNHKNTEYRNAQAPTCSEKGKEADLFCLDCQTVIAVGAEIPATGNHVCASGEWKHDENGHFHICDNCQTEFDRENHKGGEATCKAAAVCEVCGTNYGDLDANNHKNIVLKNNVAPTCKDPGYSGDKVCEDCGTVVETGHEIAATGEHVDADGKWEFDGTNHFHTCGCGTKFDFAPHEGGEATCVAAKICTVCGASYGDIDANNHKNTHVVGKQDATCCEKGYTGDVFCDDCQTTITYGTEIAATGNHVDTDGKWNFDENGHFHTCYFGTEFDRENHRGGEATCITRATCEVCGHSYGETDRTNHKSIAVVGAVAATETSTGYTGDKVCEDCHATVEAGTEIPMLEHNPAKVEAKAATSAEKGNIEYWYCENCGKYYSDAECQNEITKEETEIAKLAPTMIEGNGSKVDKAEKKGLTFKSDAAFADFIGVEIDGKAVDASAYTVKGDNIEIELTAEFIKTLSVGEHSIAIASESGKAAATFTVTDSSVKKPDGTNDTAMSVWMLILTVSGAAVVFAGKKKFAK